MGQIEILENFFLDTVWGILTLGAMGSIVGSITLSLIRRLLRTLNERKGYWFESLIYPYRREKLISLDVAANATQPSAEAKFMIFCISKQFEWLLVSVCLIVSALLTAIIILFYGYERPYVLSCSVSLTLMVFHGWLMTGFSTGPFNYIDHALERTARERVPATYKELHESGLAK